MILKHFRNSGHSDDAPGLGSRQTLMQAAEWDSLLCAGENHSTPPTHTHKPTFAKQEIFVSFLYMYVTTASNILLKCMHMKYYKGIYTKLIVTIKLFVRMT